MSILVRTVVDQVEAADAGFSFPKHDSARALYRHYLGAVQTKGAELCSLQLGPVLGSAKRKSAWAFRRTHAELRQVSTGSLQSDRLI